MTAVPAAPPFVVTKCAACDRLIVTSSSAQISLGAGATRITQNDRHFFVAALNAPDVLAYADVPYLDFDQSLTQFCNYTIGALSTPPGSPRLWQRPLDDGRVNALSGWL